MSARKLPEATDSSPSADAATSGQSHPKKPRAPKKATVVPRVPRSRSRSAAKAAGRQLENDLVTCLNKFGLDAYRLRQKGSNDEGDVRSSKAPDHVFECKNTRSVQLAQWWKETVAEMENAQVPYGWMVHKRHGISAPELQWVTTTAEVLSALLARVAKLEEENKLHMQMVKHLVGTSNSIVVTDRKGD